MLRKVDERVKRGELDSLTAATEHSFDGPEWLKLELENQYPGDAELLAAQANRAPMAIRVNTNTVSPTDYCAALDEAKIAYQSTDLAESFVLEQALPSMQLPGWQEGWVAVQDFGAQLVGEVVMRHLVQDHRLLDACAAPGGKLFHIAERCQDKGISIQHLALEVSAKRAAATNTIAERLGHSINLKTADAAATDSWWDGEVFDVILLDAPCSGTGTLRRHPEIRLLLSAEQIPEHAALQLELLTKLWPTLRTGGKLVYCTCSLLAQENDDVVYQFVKSLDNAQFEAIDLPSGQQTEHGWQLMPSDPHTDGFYISTITKVEAH